MKPTKNGLVGAVLIVLGGVFMVFGAYFPALALFALGYFEGEEIKPVPQHSHFYCSHCGKRIGSLCTKGLDTATLNAPGGTQLLCADCSTNPEAITKALKRALGVKC